MINESFSNRNNDIVDDIGENQEKELHITWNFTYQLHSFGFRGLNAYKQSIKTHGTFNSVERFFQIYSEIGPVGQLKDRDVYHLFKIGYEPVVESDNLRDGCRLMLDIEVDFSINIDETWEKCVKSVIGNNLDIFNKLIVGLDISRKPNIFRIGFWTDIEISLEEINHFKQMIDTILGVKFVFKFENNKETVERYKNLSKPANDNRKNYYGGKTQRGRNQHW